jgi:hypothetical protein
MFDGSGPDKWFLDMSNAFRFGSNRGIGPVRWFEFVYNSSSDVIFVKFF